MARLIRSKATSKPLCNILTMYKDGTSVTRTYTVGDSVENLRYVKNEEIVTISGVITDIGICARRAPQDSKLEEGVSTLTRDIEVDTISITYNGAYSTITEVIPAMEILEFDEDDDEKEVARMSVTYGLVVNIETLLSDNTNHSVEVKEGDDLYNLSLLGAGVDMTMNCHVCAFNYTIESSNSILVTQMWVRDMESGVVEMIDFKRVRLLGTNALCVTTIAEAQTILESTGSYATLTAMQYPRPISLARMFDLDGAEAGVIANEGIRAAFETMPTETVLTGVIELGQDAEVVFDGITFEDDAHIIINGAKSLTIRNCRFVDATLDKAKTMLIQSMETATPLKLIIEHCYFGDNHTVNGNKMYNLFELTGLLADGSTIENCYFEEFCCTHNQINFYNAVDGATLKVKNNYFGCSRNAVRVGPKGEPTCRIEIEGNTYINTDPDPAWAGIVLIQPYSTETTSMKNCTVIISDTTKPEGQLWYTYTDSGTLQFTDDNKPTVIVDGVIQEVQNSL